VSPPWLAAGLGLASVVLAAALGSAAAAAAVHAARTSRFGRLGARTRATLLAQARLAPAVFAAPLVAVVQAAFWRFEPAHGAEPVGPLLAGAALAGAALLATSTLRVAHALRATARLRRAWQASARAVDVPGWQGRAYVIDSTYPVVAVAGVWRPELYVASQVTDACTPAELAQVAAHERAHVTACDNLMRAAFAATPLPWRTAARLEQAWAAAAEEAADQSARDGGCGVSLASALVKVAGLALPPLQPPAGTLASAFIGAESLDGRVRRLLAPAGAPGRAMWWASLAWSALAVAAGTTALASVYAAAEFLVGFGR
jgi:Zn-dependent protease with chaperone function